MPHTQSLFCRNAFLPLRPLVTDAIQLVIDVVGEDDAHAKCDPDDLSGNLWLQLRRLRQALQNTRLIINPDPPKEGEQEDEEEGPEEEPLHDVYIPRPDPNVVEIHVRVADRSSLEALIPTTQHLLEKLTPLMKQYRSGLDMTERAVLDGLSNEALHSWELLSEMQFVEPT